MACAGREEERGGREVGAPASADACPLLLRAGALGFSTSRTVLHRSIDGELVPGTTATEEEAASLAAADTVKRQRREVMTNMEGEQIAKAIIKNKAADEYMHVLAIARRCRYCMEA